MTTVSWRQTTTTPRHVNVTSHVTGPWRHIYVIASHWLAVFNGGSRREWVGEPLAGTFKGKTLQKTGIWDAAPEATELNVSDSHRCVQFARSSDEPKGDHTVYHPSKSANGDVIRRNSARFTKMWCLFSSFDLQCYMRISTWDRKRRRHVHTAIFQREDGKQPRYDNHIKLTARRSAFHDRSLVCRESCRYSRSWSTHFHACATTSKPKIGIYRTSIASRCKNGSEFGDDTAEKNTVGTLLTRNGLIVILYSRWRNAWRQWRDSLTSSHGTLGVAGNGEVGWRTRTSTVDAQRTAFTVDRPATTWLVDVPYQHHHLITPFRSTEPSTLCATLND